MLPPRSRIRARLPLLSFTLDKLYRDCVARGSGDRRLVEQGVRGLASALSEHADGIYARLDEPTQATMRRVLLRMVAFDGEGVSRRQVPRSELVYADPAETPRVEKVLYELTADPQFLQPGQPQPASIGLRLAIVAAD